MPRGFQAMVGRTAGPSVFAECRTRRGVATDKKQSERKRSANDHDKNPSMPSRLSRRSCTIDIFRTLQSFRGQFECPRDHERDWKSDHDCEHDEAHRPVRNFEKRKDLSRDLHEQPPNNRIGNGNLVNVAPLQLGEEVVDLHSFASDFGATTFCTSASKRGSPCNESSSGSTLIQQILEPSRSS